MINRALAANLPRVRITSLRFLKEASNHLEKLFKSAWLLAFFISFIHFFVYFLHNDISYLHIKVDTKWTRNGHGIFMLSQKFVSVIFHSHLIKLLGIFMIGFLKGFVVNSCENLGTFFPATSSFHVFRRHNI